MKETTRTLGGGTYVSLQGDQDWPAPPESTDANWTAAVASIVESNAALIAAVSELSEDALCEKVGGQEFSLYGLLHGVAQHNIYHAGQIVLLKKAAG